MSIKISLRKIIVLMIVALFISVLAYALTSCTTDNKDNTVKAGTLTVAVEDSFYPWTYKNVNGEIGGFNVAYCNKLCKDAGYDVEYVPMEFNRILTAVRNHEVDISIDNLKITDERKQMVDFSKPYNKEGVDLYIPTKSGHTLNSLREKSKTSEVKIAIQDGTYYNPAVDQLDTAKIVKYISIDDILKALNNGEVDAAIDISDSVAYYSIAACNGYPIDNGTKKDVAIAINKSVLNVADKLNAAIDKENENQYLDKIQKYFRTLEDPMHWDGKVPDNL